MAEGGGVSAGVVGSGSLTAPVLDLPTFDWRHRIR